MKIIPKSRIDEAKRIIRETFTFEYMSKLPENKGLTLEKYKELIETLETLCFLGINYYLSTIKSY